MINIEELLSRSKEIGYELSRKQAEMLDCYAEMLVEANRTVNLTRIDTPDEMLEKHFADCLYACKHIDNGEKVADVGCGAGFPGMVIAIACNAHVTFIDSVGKKLSFISDVCNELGIEAQFINERAEVIGRNPDQRDRYDYVTARAVARLNTLIEYCSPLVKVGGKFIAMKGKDADIEVDEVENASNELKCKITDSERYTVNGDEQRSIIVFEKFEATPEIYPRTTKKISKQPL